MTNRVRLGQDDLGRRSIWVDGVRVPHVKSVRVEQGVGTLPEVTIVVLATEIDIEEANAAVATVRIDLRAAG